MYDIYDHHASEYHRLVSAEDYQGNLPRYLLGLTEWNGKSVLEAGVGTGRLTRIYGQGAASITCCDRSSHMIEAASHYLSRYSNRINFLQADNLSMPQLELNADVFIEGWSWGHSIVDRPESVKETCGKLLEGALTNLTDNGLIVIVETMGTNVIAPTAPHSRLAEFYRLLEETYSFKSEIIQTDYLFESVEEAARIMGFFFGADMEGEIAKNRITMVREWTGIWTRTGK